MLDEGGNLYVEEWFSPTHNGRRWFKVDGPGVREINASWENFSSAVVAGQWVQTGGDGLPNYGSVKGQQLSYNNTCL